MSDGVNINNQKTKTGKKIVNPSKDDVNSIRLSSSPLLTMRYIHVKNLEKYHPGYKDRILLWAKIHIKMIQGDPDCEMITDETDWARLVKFILLELNAQKPIPLDPMYLQKKGFDLKKRPIRLTINMLQKFIEVVPELDTECTLDVTQNRIEKSRVEEEKSKKKLTLTDTEFISSLKENPAYKGIAIDTELSKMDAWLLTRPQRKKTRSFIVNWLNKIDKPMEIKQPEIKKPIEKRELDRPPTDAEAEVIREAIENVGRK